MVYDKRKMKVFLICFGVTRVNKFNELETITDYQDFRESKKAYMDT